MASSPIPQHTYIHLEKAFPILLLRGREPGRLLFSWNIFRPNVLLSWRSPFRNSDFQTRYLYYWVLGGKRSIAYSGKAGVVGREEEQTEPERPPTLPGPSPSPGPSPQPLWAQKTTREHQVACSPSLALPFALLGSDRVAEM